jgi:hypothetical protein
VEAADVRGEGISNFTDEMKKSPREFHHRTILSPAQMLIGAGFRASESKK